VEHSSGGWALGAASWIRVSSKHWLERRSAASLAASSGTPPGDQRKFLSPSMEHSHVLCPAWPLPMQGRHSKLGGLALK